MYTFEVLVDPIMSNILKDGVVIDHTGPWESTEAATAWATLFVEKCNGGFDPF
jgi:hypothetical protein